MKVISFSSIFSFVLIFFNLLTYSPRASALEIDSFAEGACWLSEEISASGQTIKLVSFNDNVAVSFTKEDIFYFLNELELDKRFKKHIQQADFNYHCGGYGHSVVVIDRSGDQCLWLYYKDGNWQIRSKGIIGPLEAQTKSCHGLKAGSLVLSINDNEDKESVKNELIKTFTDEIESFSELSKRVLKINLKESYVGSEKAVREKLMQNHFVGPRVKIDFNWLSHPVGEFKE